MEESLTIGLRLSAIGLGVTFLALTLVILVMELLVRLFPQARAAAVGEAGAAVGGDMDEQTCEELAVALAVGVALAEGPGPETRDPSLGKLLESQHPRER